MISISQWVHNHFGWLVERCAFRETVIDPNDVRLIGPNVSIRITYNPRDGCDFFVCRNDDKDACFGITGLTAALDTYRAQYEPLLDFEDLKDAQKIEEEIKKAADFLNGEGKSILSGDRRLFDELSKLRFWHSGRWVEEWGKGITMTEDEIEENRKLVPQIIRLLGQN